MATFQSNSDATKQNSTESATEWKPITGMTLGTMSLSSNFVTSVTDNGAGDYTLGLDYTQNAQNFQNADRYFFDLITDWSRFGSENYDLQLRVEFVSDPDVKTGDPYVGVMVVDGDTSSNDGHLCYHIWDSAGTSYMGIGVRLNLSTSFVNTTNGTDSGAAASSYIATFRALESTPSTLYSSAINGSGASYYLQPLWANLSTVQPLISPTKVNVGYNQSTGVSFSVGFCQGSSTTGTGSMRLKLHYRFLKVALDY